MPPTAKYAVHGRLVDLENSATELRREVAALRSEFARLKTLCDDVINMDRHRSEYISWLLERRQQRLKSS